MAENIYDIIIKLLKGMAEREEKFSRLNLEVKEK